ncbi:MAG: serine kinase [Firmicutes bacterium]|nr:serine kinase [Bacillota bacterium]
MAKEMGLRIVASAAGDGPMDRTVTGGYCSDLLSDVMANAREGHAWITIQTHRNVIAVAVLTGVAAVIIAGGKQPDSDTLEKAAEEGVTVLLSGDPSFEVAGRLYSLLQDPC